MIKEFYFLKTKASFCKNIYVQFISIGLILILGINCNSQETNTKNPVLKQAWHTSAPFKSPESIIYDSKRKFIYVTNGVGYAENGKGLISKLSSKGKLLKLKWIENLNRPTGMAIYDNKLYVADIDELLLIDLEKEKLIKKYSVTISNPMLNDVAISNNGNIYVTASGNHSVFQLKNEKLTVAYQEDSVLKYANGIVVQNNQLTVAGWELAKINLNTNKIEKLQTIKKLNDFDGLVINKDRDLFCTQVSEKGKLWKILPSGEGKLIFSYDNYLADFDSANIDGKSYIILATGNHKSKQYGVLALLLVK